MIPQGTLVRLLASGRPRTAASLARALGITVPDLDDLVSALGNWGLAAEPAPRRSYRLPEPLDCLDGARLAAALAPRVRERLDRLEVHDAIDSTNARLWTDFGLAPGQFRACLAEYQSAGRGRRGRQWLQPFGSGLCLSVSWLFPRTQSALGSLSLAVGVAVRRALSRHGVGGTGLKWPNDVLRGDGKLGGILCELRIEPEGGAYVVIGVGLNVRVPEAVRARISAGGGLPPADLGGGPLPSRTLLAAAVIDEIVLAALEFESHGFGPFAGEWSQADALLNRPVRLQVGDGTREGVARGIDGAGALCVEIDGRLETLAAGEVTLRAVA